MANLRIEHLNKRYGAATVLNDVSLSIEAGEFVVLVGPSGCGKSTLLRMIAGLDGASSGDIHIAGRLVNTLAPAERGIAMVFQSYALYPHMDVRKNMTFGLKFTGVPPAERKRRVAEAARMLRLEELLERYPRDLSGGQRQRVAIGRAIVREPAVFLFDEPLSNLDAALRVSTRVEIASRLFSMTNTTGSLWIAAKLIASWKSPGLVDASPPNAKTMFCSFRLRIASARPTACGNSVPTHTERVTMRSFGLEN